MSLLRQHIKAGTVYRRSDLEYYSTAIDRQLSQLTKEGILQKLNHGLYYAPKETQFGTLPPQDHDLIERFLKTDSFLMISPNSYNMLGLGLTQLYNTTWVYNHKRRGEFTFLSKRFLFVLKSDFPKTLSKEYLAIDLLNNLGELAEDKERILHSFQMNLNRFEIHKLMEMARRYGSGTTKQTIRNILKKSAVLYD